MRISLALGTRQRLSPQTAWGCLTSNVALPGSGSLIAGRAAGYAQLALAGGGLAWTMVFGARFVLWYVANWSHMNDPMADPLATMAEFWQAVRWPLLGIAGFGAGWLWALATSLAIVREARRGERPAPPPRLN
jgi:hypothetical protein